MWRAPIAESRSRAPPAAELERDDRHLGSQRPHRQHDGRDRGQPDQRRHRQLHPRRDDLAHLGRRAGARRQRHDRALGDDRQHHHDLVADQRDLARRAQPARSRSTTSTSHDGHRAGAQQRQRRHRQQQRRRRHHLHRHRDRPHQRPHHPTGRARRRARPGQLQRRHRRDQHRRHRRRHLLRRRRHALRPQRRRVRPQRRQRQHHLPRHDRQRQRPVSAQITGRSRWHRHARRQHQRHQRRRRRNRHVRPTPAARSTSPAPPRSSTPAPAPRSPRPDRIPRSTSPAAASTSTPPAAPASSPPAAAPSPCRARGNTIDSVSATALNVANTTIGASDLNFLRVSSGNTTARLIRPTASSSTPPARAAASSSSVTAAPSSNGSGGVIQNTTGTGVVLTSTRDVSLSYLNVTNSGDDGIHANAVTNFTLNRPTSTTTATPRPTTACSSARPAAAWSACSARLDRQHLDQRERAQRLLAAQHVGHADVLHGQRQHVQRRQRHDRRQRVPVRGLRNLDDDVGLDHRQHVPEQHATARARGPGARHGDVGDAYRLGQHVRQQRDPGQLHAGHVVNLTFKFINNGTVATPMTGSILQNVNVFSSSQSTAAPWSARSRATGSATRPSRSAGGAAISGVIQGQTNATLLIDGNTIRQTSGDSRAINSPSAGRAAARDRHSAANTVVATSRSPTTTSSRRRAVRASRSRRSWSRPTTRPAPTTSRRPCAPTSAATPCRPPPVFDLFSTQIGFYEYDPPGGHGIGQTRRTAPASADATAQLTSTNTGTASACGVGAHRRPDHHAAVTDPRRKEQSMAEPFLGRSRI